MPARSKVTPKVRSHEVGDLPPEHEAHQTSKAEVQLLHVHAHAHVTCACRVHLCFFINVYFSLCYKGTLY